MNILIIAQYFFHYDEFEHIIFEDTILLSKIQIRTATRSLQLNNTEILPSLVENSTIQQLNKLICQLDTIKVQNKTIKPLDWFFSFTYIVIMLVVVFIIILGVTCTLRYYFKRLKY